jgi:hypothetical protein
VRSQRGDIVFLLLAFFVVVCSACASPKKHALDIPISGTANPTNGPAVVIEPVVDARVFVESSDDPAQHQLATNGVGDPSVTARAFAQQRNLFSNPMLDLELPEGRSVSQLVNDARIGETSCEFPGSEYVVFW